jgi:hypothetical protein
MKLNHLATLVFGLNTFECHWHGFQVLCSKAWKMVGQTGWSVSIARSRCYDFKNIFAKKICVSPPNCLFVQKAKIGS